MWEGKKLSRSVLFTRSKPRDTSILIAPDWLYDLMKEVYESGYKQAKSDVRDVLGL